MAVSLGPRKELRPAGARMQSIMETEIGLQEKSYVAFALGDFTSDANPSMYVQQQICTKMGARARSIVYRVDVSSGLLTERHVSDCTGIEAAVGFSTPLRGGTPAVRLDRDTFLAIGHTMAHHKLYTMFAYTFSASPPFSRCGGRRRRLRVSSEVASPRT